MSRSYHSRVSDLHRRARELSAGRRHEFLAAECGDDVRLRQDVESLLARDEAAGEVFPDSRCAADDASAGSASSRPTASLRVAPEDSSTISTTLTAGQVLGRRYRIRAFLGRGGMGEVWHALDLKLRVDVALKSLRRERFADPHALALMRREVRSAREVISPNVCRIFDLVEVDGQELVSMEYIDGDTLDETLRQDGSLDLLRAGEIASQFLAGLEAIHQAGLVHRDVKPENIMLTRAGRVVLMDFGLAKPESDRGATLAGTPAYMAPEQVRGDAVDARTDLYAAGIVLAEMLSTTGTLESREPIQRGVHVDPPQLPDTPWRSVLLKCVAQKPADRHPSASALTRAIEEVTLRVEGAEVLRPYPGLAAFTEADAEYFFGREAEIETAWAKLRRPHLLALIGPSGAGKSSFLRAGLKPMLPEGWQAAICTPGSRPFLALADMLASDLTGDADVVHDLLRFEEPDVAVEVVRRWRQRSDQALLIVDQFEELFTLNPPEVQFRFAELLARVALEADVRVLLSMRDDFLFHCHEFPALTPLFSELTPLSAPTGAALRRALVQPALKCGYRFEDDALVDEMLASVADERGALPLLAFAVSRLWEQRDRQTGVLTRGAYDELGGVGGALAQHAEATLERIGEEHLPLVRELFRNLITAQDTRAAREWGELLSVFDDRDRDAADAVLRELVDARLLTSYEERRDERLSEAENGDEGDSPQQAAARRVEIIHESLLTAWPRLVRWRTQDADSAQLRDQLRQSAQMWEERDRTEDLLWSGSVYKEYTLWRERYPGGLTDTEEAFAVAMAGRAGRHRRRRRVAATGAVGVLLAVLAVVTVLWQQSEAAKNRAEASVLLALGQQQLEDNPSAALAHASAALELADLAIARHFALEALWRGPTAIVLPDAVGEALGFRFGPDGSWLAGSGQEGFLAFWKNDGSPPVDLQGHATSRSVVVEVSNDIAYSRFLVSGARENDSIPRIRIWSLPEGKEERVLEPVGLQGFWVHGGRFLVATRSDSGDGFLFRRWLLEGGEPDTVGVWGGKWPAVFDPGGEWIAWGEDGGLYLLPVDGVETATPRRLGDWQEPFRQVAFDPGGEQVAWAEASGLYVLPLVEWETAAPRRLAGAANAIRGIAFFHDGEMIGARDASNVVRHWSLAAETSTLVRTIRLGDVAGDEQFILLAGGGSWMASARFGGETAWLHDLAGPAFTEPLALRRGELIGIQRMTLDPSGTWLATAATGGVTLWPLSRQYAQVLTERGVRVTSVVFDPDGEWLASPSPSWGDDGQTVILWSLTDRGEEPRVLLGPLLAMMRVGAVSPDGEHLALSLQNGDVVIVPVAGGDPRVLPGKVPFPAYPTFDREGRRVAAAGASPAGDTTIRIWDLESEEVRLLDPGDGGPLPHLQFTGDGHLLSSGLGGLRLWDLDSGESELLIEGSAGGRLDPAGRYFLGVRRAPPLYAGEAFVLDLQERRTWDLTRHGRQVRSVAWLPAGDRVITGSTDGVIRIGSATGAEPHLLYGHEGMVWSLAVDPDGSRIASAGNDGTVRLWPVPEGRPFHALPRDELLDRLRALTNFRVVRDDDAPLGYRVEVGPCPGWEKVPTW